MSIKIVMWNINKQTDSTILLELLNDKSPNLLFLYEANESICEEIENKSDYKCVKSKLKSPKKKLFCLRAKDVAGLKLLQEYKKRLDIYKLVFSENEFIIASLHFPSKLYFKPEAQLCEAIDYATQIRKIENDFKIFKTIILGDFNMNPFDTGMIAANAFNSIISKEIAKTGPRTIQEKQYRYFYNPAWKIYGSDCDIYGTYYLNNPNHSDLHWNIYDQVLISPEILQSCSYNFENINSKKYFNHQQQSFSDHTPIYFELKFEESNDQIR